MKIREAAAATFNLYWDGTRNEEECARLSEVWCEAAAGAEVSVFTRGYIIDLCGEWKRSGSSNGTLNRRLACLSKILNTAKDLGGLDTIPQFPRFAEAPHRERFLSDAEEDRLLDKLGQPAKRSEQGSRDARTLLNAIVILLDTGARVGELFKARATDLKLEVVDHVPYARAWMIPESKSGKPRTIPLTERAAQAWMGQGQQYEPLPFGQAMTRSRFNHKWESLRREVDLEDVRLHNLRHTFASRLVQRGETIYVVQHLLGHRSVTTTQRYAHLNSAAFAGAINLLEPED